MDARGDRRTGLWTGWRSALLVLGLLGSSVSAQDLPKAPSVPPLPSPAPPAAATPSARPLAPGVTPPAAAPERPGLIGGTLRGEVAPPGRPQGLGRPRPGSIFDPGASGPGISRWGNEHFLDGAFDTRTGWPLVLLDHFRPRPERVDRFWVVQTRECPQEMGTDPWPCLKVLHFDAEGELQERDPAELLAQVQGHPVLVQVQGSLTTPDIALGGLMWTHSWLTYNRVLPDDAVVIAFDWPSQRVYRLGARDINEKGRRAFVAAFHLARFIQAFPPESRICLLGQSYGGRVVPSALHLLGGGCLNSQAHDPWIRLPTVRSDLRLRGIIIAGASDHDWLDPGERLDRALPACEAFLNLYNRRDEALRLYPFLVRSGHRRALGRLGLTNRDLQRLGPVAARYAEYDVHDVLKNDHTLLDAVANPEIAQRMALYLFNPNPPASPPMNEAGHTPTSPGAPGTGLFGWRRPGS